MPQKLNVSQYGINANCLHKFNIKYYRHHTHTQGLRHLGEDLTV